MAETHKSKPSMQGGSNKQSAMGNKSQPGSSRGSSTAKSQQSSARGSGSEQKSGNDKNR